MYADTRIDDEGRLLTLVLEGCAPVAIEAATLWVNCPSAARRRRRLEGSDLVAPAGIAVRSAIPIGNYAVNIAFSDGHDRGVYPWALLQELARRPKVADFLIAPMPYDLPCGAHAAAPVATPPISGKAL